MNEQMTSKELHSTLSLVGIMSLRMLGLFMIVPIFSLYAADLPRSTPFLIGMAMGIYGLTQGLFQIPFGMLSDHFGRKPIIALGLAIFALGSFLCAISGSIKLLIIGRALQGAGAVGSTIIASIADLTRDNQRTKAMAINGISIGMSFSLAIVLGPLFAAWIGVTGIFWLAILFSIVGMAILFFIVPEIYTSPLRDSNDIGFFTLLTSFSLARLNASVFLLHAIFTASFIVIPISLLHNANFNSNQQWLVYLPTLMAAFIASIVMLLYAEKHQQIKTFFIAGVGILILSEGIFYFWKSLWGISLGLFLFFTAFSLLEAFLPSIISRIAPKARKGTALGIYSCSQFLGIFAGGAMGGWIYGAFGLTNVYLFCVVAGLIWATIASGIQNPQQPSTPQ